MDLTDAETLQLSVIGGLVVMIGGYLYISSKNSPPKPNLKMVLPVLSACLAC
ncbi:hypothetical protein PCI56_14880 [Plesiomonas shigelloides subsp. oncorhynchi]|nr:hypothetical protein [Plesiomonas shigelloides]